MRVRVRVLMLVLAAVLSLLLVLVYYSFNRGGASKSGIRRRIVARKRAV